MTGDKRAEVVADDRLDAVQAQGCEQGDRVAGQPHLPVRAEVGVVGVVPAGGAAVSALVRGDDVVAGGRQRRGDLAPGISQFREAVQQQQRRPSGLAGLHDVHAQAVHAVDKTAPQAFDGAKMGLASQSHAAD